MMRALPSEMLSRRRFLAHGTAGVVGLLGGAAVRTLRAEVPDTYRPTIEKGFRYLAKNQYPDGHWHARAGMYPTSVTGLAGLAFLMEGSTIRDGRFQNQIRKAADWYMDRAQSNGLIGDPKHHPSESSHYMHGHGYAMLFLSQIYGEEDDGDRRRKLHKILSKAVEFCGNAQTSRGGWGYISAKDSGDADEGSTTITQMQALRALRNAGIVVPKKIVDRGMEYLKNCTTPRGGIIYRPGMPGERPALTAAAVACSFAAGDYSSTLVKRWLRFCKDSIPLNAGGAAAFGHWEYTHFYFAQTIYFLSEKRYAEMFPESKPAERLTWTKYRDNIFPYLVSRQAPTEGSWNLSGMGEAYSTACALAILQLDNGALPIFQR